MSEAQNQYKRCCILLSGGVGSRLESTTPKQYLPVAGRCVIEHTILALRSWAAMDALVIVADDKWLEHVQAIVIKSVPRERAAFLGCVEPGVNRQFSILNALREIKPHMAEGACVMIHDAVRPCVSEELIRRCDAALGQGDGVMPYLKLKDTVYISSDAKQIEGNIDRDSLVAGQTPEFYDYWKYLAANAALSEEEISKIHGSTEVAVSAGMKMVLVPGEEGNFKITTKEDMERFRRMRERR